MRSSECNHDPETTVLCHLNEYEFGKGMGIKADDMAAFYGCSSCHDLYDGRAKQTMSERHMDEMAFRAVIRTHIRMKEKGVLK
jgi:hypothetical protein